MASFVPISYAVSDTKKKEEKKTDDFDEEEPAEEIKETATENDTFGQMRDLINNPVLLQ